MEIEYDPEKNAKNIRERGLSFDLVKHFEMETAMFVRDKRKDYGETRWQALGKIGSRVFAVVFTVVPGGIRVISFRKANKREVRRYEQQG